MSKLDKLFAKQLKKREADKKALEVINKMKNKTNRPATMYVPKTMKEKVEYAKQVSLQVFGNKLDDMELVTDEKRIEEYFIHAANNGILAIDTETDGLNRIDGKVAGVCLYTPGEKEIYIPVEHYSYMTGKLLDINVDREILRKWFETLENNNIKFILHNAKFDMHILYWMIGVKITPYWDTMIAGYLLNENEPHGLKALYQKYVVADDEDQQTAKFNTLFKGVPFTNIPPQVGYMYAAFDPKMTYDLYKFQEPYLTKDDLCCQEKGLERVADVFREIEMPLIPVVFEMECRGVAIDTELAKQLHYKYSEYMTRAEITFKNEIDKLADKIQALQSINPVAFSKIWQEGKPNVSISSNDQLAILFYDVLKLVSPDKGKPRGTGEDIISTFKHPIIAPILEYRAMAKLLSTYIDAIPQHISKRTGRLHASFNQYGAKTGRFSSSDPNLQNIPSQKKKLSDGTVIDAGHDIRQMFIAGEGMAMVGGDFSQQEPRCLAHMSQDEKMLQAYRDGKDLYATMASEIYNMPYEECMEFRPDGTVNPEGKARRTSVKPVLLGIMYGRGIPSIAEQMHITPKEAQKIVDDFFQSFPKIKEFVNFAQSFARDYGFVETAWGRKRRLTDMTLDPIEIYKEQSSDSDNFDALDWDSDEDDDYVDDETYYKYLKLMNNAWGRQQKEQVKLLAKQEGYRIVDNGGKIEDAKRQCVNSIIQGSASDMTKRAMIQIQNDPILRELEYQLIIPVHDEVIGLCPIENAKAVSERLEHIMIHIVDGIFSIQMKTDIEVTTRWYGDSIDI